MSSRAQERAAALLLAALEHNNPDLPEYPDAYLRWLAAALSAALAAREQQQASFASRVRSLCFNLKANHELRRQLCARERSAAETAAMSTSGVPSGRSNPNLAGFARDDSPRAAALQCTQADLTLTRLIPAPRPWAAWATEALRTELLNPNPNPNPNANPNPILTRTLTQP